MYIPEIKLRVNSEMHGTELTTCRRVDQFPGFTHGRNLPTDLAFVIPKLNVAVVNSDISDLSSQNVFRQML